MLEINDVVTQLPSDGSNGERRLRHIRYAVVHHDGVLARAGYDPIKRYQSQARYHMRRGWSRLAYHFRIDRMGNIYLTNRLEEITYHAGNFPVNVRGLGICLDGDMTRQDVTHFQRNALIGLLEYLTTERPDMPYLVKSTVKTHREVKPVPTTCPSNSVQALLGAWRTPACRPLI